VLPVDVQFKAIEDFLVSGETGKLAPCEESLDSLASQLRTLAAEGRLAGKETPGLIHCCRQIRALLESASVFHSGRMQAISIQTFGYTPSGAARSLLSSPARNIDLRG
jgi:hypothetical protein